MKKFQKIPKVNVLRRVREMLKNSVVNNLGKSWFSYGTIPVKSKNFEIFSEMNGLG